MNDLYISNIVTLLIIIGAFFFLKNYLPSYFNQKGINLAQKEDIEGLTRQVEIIKNEFTRETDLLKTKLQRLITLETSHRNEERIALINFYSKYNEWLYAILETNIFNYNRNNVQDIIERRKYVAKYYAETNVTQSLVKLLVKNDEIVISSHVLMDKILHLKAWFDMTLLHYQQLLDRHNDLSEKFLPMLGKYEEKREEMNKLAKQEEELIKAEGAMTQRFYPDLTIEFETILTVNKEFTELVKNYLTE